MTRDEVRNKLRAWCGPDEADMTIACMEAIADEQIAASLGRLADDGYEPWYHAICTREIARLRGEPDAPEQPVEPAWRKLSNVGEWWGDNGSPVTCEVTAVNPKGFGCCYYSKDGVPDDLTATGSRNSFNGWHRIPPKPQPIGGLKPTGRVFQVKPGNTTPWFTEGAVSIQSDDHVSADHPLYGRWRWEAERIALEQSPAKYDVGQGVVADGCPELPRTVIDRKLHIDGWYYRTDASGIWLHEDRLTPIPAAPAPLDGWPPCTVEWRVPKDKDEYWSPMYNRWQTAAGDFVEHASNYRWTRADTPLRGLAWLRSLPDDSMAVDAKRKAVYFRGEGVIRKVSGGYENGEWHDYQGDNNVFAPDTLTAETCPVIGKSGAA